MTPRQAEMPALRRTPPLSTRPRPRTRHLAKASNCARWCFIKAKNSSTNCDKGPADAGFFLQNILRVSMRSFASNAYAGTKHAFLPSERFFAEGCCLETPNKEIL